MFPSFVCWWNVDSLPRAQMPGFHFPDKMDAGVLGCASEVQSLSFTSGSLGDLRNALLSPVPPLSYLKSKGIGLAAPRQLQYVMCLGFKCFRSGGETWGESKKPGKSVGKLRNEQMRQSGEHLGKTIQRLNSESWSPLHRVKCLCMDAVCLSERIVLQQVASEMPHISPSVFNPLPLSELYPMTSF